MHWCICSLEQVAKGAAPMPSTAQSVAIDYEAGDPET